ncbi:arylamine N-acetyltransferase [Marinomonas sp. THO17]|uniref:arylamine N-acetyltransferase family protein n=1 Tax=Marinomonas sp. THO17 TaxID=3149048 RepID=UPI00336BF7FE
MSDLQAYLDDLQLTVPTSQSLDFVCSLQSHHIAQYSFNNLAVLLGEDISLNLSHILDKIVIQGFGGYCFEHNKLAFEFLSHLGYDVRLVMARVLNGQLLDRPRTHRITLVSIQDDVYLVDMGFGADCPTQPLRLEPDIEQTIATDTYRIVKSADGEFDLQIWKPQSKQFYTLYRFDLAHYTDEDCVLGNFYSSKHPKAVFVNNLVASIKDDKRTAGIRNHVYFIRQNGTETECLIESAEALHKLLAEAFHIHVESVIAEHLFDRFIAPKLAEVHACNAINP